MVRHCPGDPPSGFGNVVFRRAVEHRQRAHGRFPDQIPAAAHGKNVSDQDRSLALPTGRSQHRNEPGNDARPQEERARPVSLRVKSIERGQIVAHDGGAIGGRLCGKGRLRRRVAHSFRPCRVHIFKGPHQRPPADMRIVDAVPKAGGIVRVGAPLCGPLDEIGTGFRIEARRNRRTLDCVGDVRPILVIIERAARIVRQFG